MGGRGRSGTSWSSVLHESKYDSQESVGVVVLREDAIEILRWWPAMVGEVYYSRYGRWKESSVRSK
jgi:hypothetical protein